MGLAQTKSTGALYVAACYAAWRVLPLFWKTLGSVNSVYVLAARILYYMVNPMSVLLETVLFHEKLTKLQWFATALTAAGIKTTPMSLAGVLMYRNPTAQLLLLGVLVYHEEFNATHGILLGFVWTSLAIFLISDRMKQQKVSKENKPCV